MSTGESEADTKRIHGVCGASPEYIKKVGTKKIKDIFIDKKMSLHNRDSWPIVLDSKGNIVWIPGIKKSKFDKKKSEVYDIILKYSQGGKIVKNSIDKKVIKKGFTSFFLDLFNINNSKYSKNTKTKPNVALRI